MRADTQAMSDTLGGAKPKKPQKLTPHTVSLKRGHAGGYIAEHHLQDEDGNQVGDKHHYPLSNFTDVVEHLKKHMGEESREAAAEKERSQMKAKGTQELE